MRVVRRWRFLRGSGHGLRFGSVPHERMVVGSFAVGIELLAGFDWFEEMGSVVGQEYVPWPERVLVIDVNCCCCDWLMLEFVVCNVDGIDLVVVGMFVVVVL